MPTSRFVATSALALALAPAACGSLSGDTDAPSTLVTIHGTITSTSTTDVPSSLATAIVWFEESPDGTLREAADSVPVSGSFPLSFSMDVKSPPPASALIDLGAVLNPPVTTGVHYAFGYVVAYDDSNANGRLDLVDDSASHYGDTIEGVADAEVLYLEKPIPASLSASFLTIGLDGSTPQMGYNLLRPKPNYCFAQADAGAAGTCVNGWFWEPMSAAVTLNLGTSLLAPTTENDQELACAMGPSNDSSFTLSQSCGSGPCPPTVSAASFPGAFPSADDQNVTCDDLQSFNYISSCTTSATGVCQAVNTVCTQQTIVSLNPDGGTPIDPPAGWPCAAQPTPAPAFLSWLAAQQKMGSSGGSGSFSGGTTSVDAGTPSN